MTIWMTMIARGRMLRDSHRIISARGNCKVLTESDFCLLPCTPNIRFLAGITSKFIYNVGAQRSRQFVFESEKWWNFERIVKAKFKFNMRIGICKVIFEKFNQFSRRWTKIWQRYENFFLGHSDLQLFMSKYFI